MSDPPVELSRSQMQTLAEQVAANVVNEMLLKMGVDHSKPLEMQHDFQALREVRVLLTDKEFQADLSHLRKWRQTMEGSAAKGAFAAVSLLVSGLVGLLVLGFDAWTRSRGGP